jgi:VanZ family protein
MQTTGKAQIASTNFLPATSKLGNPLTKVALAWGPAMRIASVCLLLYWSAIFIGTHLPGGKIPRLANDKLMHFGAFAGLAFLVLWALPTREGQQRKQALWAIGLILGYGLVDEVTQMFIPGRHCSLADFVADALGALAGLAAYFAVKAWLVRRSWGQRLITALSK